MSDDDLKPCPFCGGVPELVDDRVGFFVRCQHCTPHWTVRYGERVPIDEQETDVAAATLITSTDWNAVRQSAIDAWNRRAPDALAAENARLREAIRQHAPDLARDLGLEVKR